MIKACLFDMDGLMFDTETAYSAVHENMSQKRERSFTAEVKATLMGKRSNEVINLLNIHWGKNEHVNSLLQEQDGELTKMYVTSVVKMAGLDKLLNYLESKGIRKCIGTSSRKSLVDILLGKYMLEDRFEFVISGDMVSKGKPDPEIYNRCVERLGIRASDCLVLEDSLNGIKSGKAAGCKTCAVPSVFTSHEDLSIADLVVKTLDDQTLINFISND